eukprot:6206789-Pleurochrysis_carterae.AAC.1
MPVSSIYRSKSITRVRALVRIEDVISLDARVAPVPRTHRRGWARPTRTMELGFLDDTKWRGKL